MSNAFTTLAIQCRRWLRISGLIGLFAIALLVVTHVPSRATSPTPSDPFALYEQGQFEQARQTWETLAEKAIQQGDRIAEIRYRINQAQALKSLGAYVRAESVLQAALSVVNSLAPVQQSEQIKLRTLNATLLRSLGEVYQAKGDLDRTRTTLQQAFDLAKQLDDQAELSAIYFSLGTVERTALLREVPRLLTTSGVLASVELRKQIEPLVNALTITSIEPQESVKPAAFPSLQRMIKHFDNATQLNNDPMLSTRAGLSQLSLLADLLPRLNFYINGLFDRNLNKIEQLVQNDPGYFIDSFIADPSLVQDLSPLKSVFQSQQLGNRGVIEPEIEILAQLQPIARQLTSLMVQQVNQLSVQQLPTDQTIAAAEVRVNMAQTLLRLKQIADESDRTDTQLRQQLKTILANVQTSYRPASKPPQGQSNQPQTKSLEPSVSPTLVNSKLPPRSLIDPVFSKVSQDLQGTRRSLFLDTPTRITLRQQTGDSLQQSTTLLTTAIDISRKLNNSRVEATGDVLLASVYAVSADLNSTVNQWRDVETLSKRAMQLVQTQDSPDLILRAQQQYARSLIKQSKTSAAQSACRVASTTLRANRQNLVAIDQDVQFSFLERVDPFYRECVSTLLSGETTAIPQNNLVDARDLIEALQLAELDNFFREACIEGRRALIEDFLKDSQNTKTAIIYPILLSNRQIGVIVKLPNVEALQYYSTGQLNEDIQAQLFKFSQNLTAGSLVSQSAETQRISRTIYDWLIKDVRSQLAGIDTLVFVPDAAFRNVPMASLYDGQRYLIDDFAIAVSPGLQLTQPSPNQQMPLQAIAAALINTPEKYNLENFPPEFVKQELDALNRVNLLTRSPLLEADFTSLELANQLQRQPSNILHLSTHAAFSSRKEKTYVLMANGRVDVDQFSAILQKRSQQQPGAIDLLFLSACQSADGDDRAALGLAGVAIKSGSRSTLATLWAVSPETTAEFTNYFYDAYVNGATRTAKTTKAKALQTALLQLKQETQDPGVWASFILVGNWL